MDEQLATASKEVLVEMVKLAQKNGKKGDKGDWKEFLKSYDSKFGASMSDPAKRSCDALRAFFQTFKEQEDIRFFSKLLKSHSNREQLKQSLKSQGSESPEQRLAHLTLEHPQYSLSYSFPSHEEDWFVTRLSKKSKGTPSNILLAVDCEMVLCEDGTEALVKICVVDRDLQVKLDKLVNPNKDVADYRSHITGVCSKDLDGVTFSIKDVQKSLKKFLLQGAILVGHSLSNDLKAMKIDHARVIDTSFIFKYGNASSRRLPSLNDLCKTILGYELRQKGAPHNCIDDACAAMKLVLAKIERGLDDIIPVSHPDVPESDLAKLFIHRIPVDFPSEELRQHMSGEFTTEILASKKGRGDKYSVFAIFKSPQEALNAYASLQGEEEKDTTGRPQKPLLVQSKSGLSSVIYVRKMARDNPSQVSAKRSYPTETCITESKKLKTEQDTDASLGNSCADHDKEIQRLKNLLNQRDQEISSLHKIITALTRKQGL